LKQNGYFVYTNRFFKVQDDPLGFSLALVNIVMSVLTHVQRLSSTRSQGFYRTSVVYQTRWFAGTTQKTP
jgi:hypothetical protein